MNIATQTEIREILHARQQIIAKEWFEIVSRSSPVSFDRAKFLPKFLDAVIQLIRALTAESFELSAVQSVGKELEILDNLQPKDIVKVQECIAQQFSIDLSPEQIVALQPRLINVLSGLCAGSFVGKAERIKTFDMSAMSMMGHDLKTPINAITGFSRVILKGIDGPITEFQQQDLTSIYDAGQKLLTMINDLFEVAKSDAAKTNIYGNSFEVSDLLGDILRTALPILAKRGNVFNLHSSGDLGMMYLSASQVRWILLSLLFFASRLKEETSISLTLNRQRIDEVDWIFFEIMTLLAPDEEGNPLLEMQSGNDVTEIESEEVGIVVSRQFTEDVGGSLTMVRDNRVATFSVLLPAREIVAETG